MYVEIIIMTLKGSRQTSKNKSAVEKKIECTATIPICSGIGLAAHSI